MYYMNKKSVTLREANQQFSRIISEVEEGATVTLTRRGKPVARLVPCDDDHRADPAWQTAYRQMETLLDEGAPLGGLKVDRDDLYDR
jgi:prevent-host-death family protein